MKQIETGKYLSFVMIGSLLACGQLSSQKAQDLAKAGDGALSASALDELFNLGLTSTGTEDSSPARVKENGLEDRLTPELQTKFEKVKAAMGSIRAEKEKICSRDSQLKSSIRDQLTAIHADTKLSAEEKKAKIEAIFENNKAALQADREAFQTCVASHQDALKVWEDKDAAIVQACGLPVREHKSSSSAEKMNLSRNGSDDLSPDDSSQKTQDIRTADDSKEVEKPETHKSQESGESAHKSNEIEMEKDSILSQLEKSLPSDACSAAIGS